MDIHTKLFICLHFILIIVTCTADNSNEYIQCANSVGSISIIAEDGALEVIPPESFQICKNKNDYCYTLWQEDPNNGSIEIKSQGMFRSSNYINIQYSYSMIYFECASIFPLLVQCIGTYNF